MYIGTIVEESLENKDIIKKFKIVSSKISEDGEWHMHKVKVSRGQIQTIAKYIKPQKWYAHFWNNDELFVVFKMKIFPLRFSKKEEWRQAIDYGKSIGIPEEQLDFIVE